MWHKYVSIAVPNYNASYHTSNGCEASRVFHGCIPYIILDLKLRIHPKQPHIPTLQVFQEVHDQTEIIYQIVRRNAMQAYIKHKVFYNKKANASTLKKSRLRNCLTAESRSSREQISFTEFWWIGPYIFEKVLPNNNYLVRKIGTKKTQVLHRMRMRQFTPHQPPPDKRLHQRRSTYKKQQTEDGQNCWQLKQNICHRHKTDVNLIASVTRRLNFNQK